MGVCVEHLGTIVHDLRRRIRVRKGEGEVVGLGMDHDEIVNKRVRRIARDHNCTVAKVNAAFGLEEPACRWSGTSRWSAGRHTLTAVRELSEENSRLKEHIQELEGTRVASDAARGAELEARIRDLEDELAPARARIAELEGKSRARPKPKQLKL